jgi:hypothetical protein
MHSDKSFNIPYRYILLYMRYHTFSMRQNCISGVMVSVLDSNAVDHVFERQSGKTKDYEIGICCFSTKHPALRRKSKD